MNTVKGNFLHVTHTPCYISSVAVAQAVSESLVSAANIEGAVLGFWQPYKIAPMSRYKNIV